MTTGIALANYHLVELLGGLVALAEHDTTTLATSTQRVWFPFGQTMRLRDDDDELYARVGLLRNKDALLAAGFCRGSSAHWDASIRAMDMVASRVGW